MKRLSKSTASKKQVRVLITTGDPDGIGWEVTRKALKSLGAQPGVQFFFYRQANSSPEKSKLGPQFKVKTVENLQQASALPFDPKMAVEICSPLHAAHWVEEAARACLAGTFQALVTAPLSKTSIHAAGLKDIGHTEILARISGESHLFMGFIGRKFSVLLMTGHEPLQQALKGLSPSKLSLAISSARKLRSILPPAKARLPMALLGVNPHAGEGGLIGREEGWMSAALMAEVRGPLVPDTAFLPKNWTRYSVFICPYHDQGLIPFKLVHGFKSGVHLTLGLPFIRTSVDHGTAKEIYGLNQAQYGSMKDALKTAIGLAKERV